MSGSRDYDATQYTEWPASAGLFTGAFTLLAVIKLDSLGGSPSTVFRSRQASGSDPWALQVGTDRSAILSRNGSPQTIAAGNANISTGGWMVVAVTKTAGLQTPRLHVGAPIALLYPSTSLYPDLTTVPTAPTTHVNFPNPFDDLALNAGWLRVGEGDSQIAAVAVWNSALSDSAIEGIISWAALKAASPTHAWRMDEGPAFVDAIGEITSSADTSATSSTEPTNFWPTVATVPNAPGNLTAVPGDNQIALDWDPVSGADFYRVVRIGTPNVQVYAGQLTAFTDTGLLGGVAQNYVVRAVNALGDSPDSPVGATPTGAGMVVARLATMTPASTPFEFDAVETGGSGTATRQTDAGYDDANDLELALTTSAGTSYARGVFIMTGGVSEGTDFWTGLGIKPAADFLDEITGDTVLLQLDSLNADGGSARASGLQQTIQVILNSTGLYVKADRVSPAGVTTLIGPIPAALAADAWNLIELRTKISRTAALTELWVNGSQIGTSTAANIFNQSDNVTAKPTPNRTRYGLVGAAGTGGVLGLELDYAYIDNTRRGVVSAPENRTPIIGSGSRAEEMLSMIPPFMRGSRLLQAIYRACGDEDELQGQMLDQLQAGLIPITSGDLLKVWEAQLGITIEPEGATIDQRTQAVVAFLSNMTNEGSAVDWKAAAVRLLGPGFTYKRHKPTSLLEVHRNLIANPNFETGITPWVGLSSGTVAQSTTQKYRGANSLRTISAASVGSGASMPAQSILTANKNYTLLARVYAPLNQAMRMRVIVSGGAGGTYDVAFTGQGAFQDVVCTFPTGVSDVNFALQFSVQTATAATFYIDTLTLTEGLTAWDIDGAVTPPAGFTASWDGTANASQSRFTEQTPPANTIWSFITFAEGTIGASLAQTMLRAITPSNTEINVTYGQGFLLDESQLDDDLL